ncbi:hypothetical protein J4409_03385 [Candidatus Woesearchaeota archaeon]|nr:hypothetical protein [Candidatus Woesearchaeota archaeon]
MGINKRQLEECAEDVVYYVKRNTIATGAEIAKNVFCENSDYLFAKEVLDYCKEKGLLVLLIPIDSKDCDISSLDETYCILPQTKK